MVTGATGAIGQVVVEQFIQNGDFVVGTYSGNLEKARELESLYNKDRAALGMKKLNITDKNEMNEFISCVVEEYGRIDVLINNAGITRDQFFATMSDGEWNDVIQTNLIGTLNMSLKVLKIMKKNNFGRIVNVSSVSGVFGRETQINYSLTKGGIIGITQLLNKFVMNYNIIINCVAPGMISTEMVKKVESKKIKSFLNYVSEKRMGEPEEIAEAVFWLASNKSAYLSSTVIHADGGFAK